MIHDLPQSVQEIADVIGRQAALYLIGQLPTCYAGKPGHKSTRVILYVPRRLTPDHRLVSILGLDMARQLANAFGGETLQVANCNDVYRRFRDAEVRRLANDNYTLAELADMIGVSQRHVRNLVRSAA